MKSVAVVALALLDGVAAFQAPAARSPTKVSKVSMFKEGDIGVTPPLGVWDPLGLMTKMPEKYRRCAPAPRGERPPRARATPAAGGPRA